MGEGAPGTSDVESLEDVARLIVLSHGQSIDSLGAKRTRRSRLFDFMFSRPAGCVLSLLLLPITLVVLLVSFIRFFRKSSHAMGFREQAIRGYQRLQHVDRQAAMCAVEDVANETRDLAWLRRITRKRELDRLTSDDVMLRTATALLAYARDGHEATDPTLTELQRAYAAVLEQRGDSTLRRQQREKSELGKDVYDALAGAWLRWADSNIPSDAATR